MQQYYRKHVVYIITNYRLLILYLLAGLWLLKSGLIYDTSYN